MTDVEIINLFFERSEQAIDELAKKHGSAVARVARNILGNKQDISNGMMMTRQKQWLRPPLISMRSRMPIEATAVSGKSNG